MSYARKFSEFQINDFEVTEVNNIKGHLYEDSGITENGLSQPLKMIAPYAFYLDNSRNTNAHKHISVSCLVDSRTFHHSPMRDRDATFLL